MKTEQYSPTNNSNEKAEVYDLNMYKIKKEITDILDRSKENYTIVSRYLGPEIDNDIEDLFASLNKGAATEEETKIEEKLYYLDNNQENINTKLEKIITRIKSLILELEGPAYKHLKEDLKRILKYLSDIETTGLKKQAKNEEAEEEITMRKNEEGIWKKAN